MNQGEINTKRVPATVSSGDAVRPAEKTNVLLVDDRAENLLAMEVVLEPLGLNLVKAKSGKEALDLIDDRDYAVILLDVQMPDWDGFETAFRIREKSRAVQTPIIFLTAAWTDEASLIRGYAEGAVDYIVKPFRPEVLRSKVRIFVELHQRVVECRSARSTLRRMNHDLERRIREYLASAAGMAGETLDLLPHPVWFADQNLQLQLTNRACTEWFGQSRGEMQGRSVRDALGQTFYDAARPSLETACLGQSARFETTLYHSEMGPRRVLVDCIPKLEDEKVTGVTGFILDATDLLSR